MKNKKIKIVVKILYVSLPLLSAILTALLTYYFNLRAIDYEKSLQKYESARTSEELLLDAEAYYKMGEISKAFEIYNMQSLETNPIALNNLAYLYENGIFVTQDIRKAKELYDRAYILGNLEVLDNWVRFNLKYPTSFTEFIDVLEQANNLGSTVVRDFFGEYVGVNNLESALEDFFGFNQDQQFYILSKRMYSEIVSDGLNDLIGERFLINIDIDTYEETECIGSYEYEIYIGDEYLSFQNLNASIPLYNDRIRSYNPYERYKFIFTTSHPTEFIYLQ